MGDDLDRQPLAKLFDILDRVIAQAQGNPPLGAVSAATVEQSTAMGDCDFAGLEWRLVRTPLTFGTKQDSGEVTYDRRLWWRVSIPSGMPAPAPGTHPTAEAAVRDAIRCTVARASKTAAQAEAEAREARDQLAALRRIVEPETTQGRAEPAPRR